MEKLEIIQEYFPSLRINNYEIIESGSHSLAIIINQDLVFRFPLKAEFNAEYEYENYVLKNIRPFISTKLPDIKIYKKANFLFSMHKIIKGTQYSQYLKEVNILPSEFQENLADEIALFIKELHSIKLNKNFKKALPLLQDYKICENLEILKECLNEPREIEDLNRTLEIFAIEDSKLKAKDDVILHDDINENNILVGEFGNLAGIIDFGNSVVGNYNRDFAALLKYDFALTMKIMQKYENLTSRKINLTYVQAVQKIKIYGGIIETLMAKPVDYANLELLKNWLKYISKNMQR